MKVKQNGHLEYHELLPRLQKAVGRWVSPEATVIVVSKGDDELLQLGARQAWHFPQRDDGAYLGYYPSDSAAAIKHLEALREKGGEYLLFPASAFWWLDHYTAFRRHLESNYPVALKDEETCLVFALNRKLSEEPQIFEENWQLGEDAAQTFSDVFDDPRMSDLEALFDLDYYTEQAGAFSTVEAAVAHYLTDGFAEGYSPNRLFDPSYYEARYLSAGAKTTNPLVHFLTHSAAELQNPNPYFDTEYYYSQNPQLRADGRNALVHYYTNVNQGKAYRPNPLFSPNYYLDSNFDVKRGGIKPFAHFISIGCEEGRFASHIHKNIFNVLRGTSKTQLLRGRWATDTVLFFVEGKSLDQANKALKIAQALGKEYHIKCMVIFAKRTDFPASDFPDVNTVVLEDFSLACEINRPSAMRLLVKSLGAVKPIFALASSPDFLNILHSEGIPSFLWLGEGLGSNSKQTLKEVFSHTTRALFESSEHFNSVARKLGYPPTNVAMLPFNENGLGKYAASLMTLAKRDFQLPESLYLVKERRSAKTTNKIIIPCSDWQLSGVNSALEAVGKELISLGWDVEILFTRDAAAVAKTIGHASHMPTIPYSFLETTMSGLEGMWEALIAYLETNAPCIMLMAYDFAANGIAAALTEKVGVILWAQSDDKDYYEQIYRLGRYCNAIVCVSNHIKASVAQLNPVIAERAHVVHNTSIWKKHIASNKPRRSKKIRLVYTGRLVQYQKRILDIVELALGMDQLKVPYEITLIGTFSPRESTKEAFKAKAKAHLADGRIKLAGRLNREQVLDEISNNDFFILLSDFEGLPLSLVEAMARGCVPVVADMKSGIREVITSGQNGLIMSGRDYNKWAKQLVTLWRDSKALAEMSQRARKTVEEQFTVEHIGSQFNELCRRVASEICSGEYSRPECLNWGVGRSPAGDVLPPPSLFSLPIQLPGLRGSR